MTTFTVPDDSDGVRLDRFLVAVLPTLSRSQIQRLIKDGQIRVGDRSAKSNKSVKAGQSITVDIAEPIDAAAQAEAIPLPILYRTTIVVVDKPAAWCASAAGHSTGTLVNALLHHVDDLSGIGGEKRPGIVHRLDRGTSGLMVVAKNDQAHEELSRQFREREVEKEYLALVWARSRRAAESSSRSGATRRTGRRCRRARSRQAVTRIVRTEKLKTLTLARIAIHTGRTHQIRVHLSAIGHPIVGDSLYGGVHPAGPGDLRAVTHLDRPFLHAARLAFTHPGDGRPMEFTSPLPDDLQHVLDELREVGKP